MLSAGDKIPMSGEGNIAGFPWEEEAIGGSSNSIISSTGLKSKGADEEPGREIPEAGGKCCFSTGPGSGGMSGLLGTR